MQYAYRIPWLRFLVKLWSRIALWAVSVVSCCCRGYQPMSWLSCWSRSRGYLLLPVSVIQGNESTTGTTCVVFTVINVTLQECVYPLNYYSIDVKW